MPLPAVIIAARRVDAATGGRGAKALKWVACAPVIFLVTMAMGMGAPMAVDAAGTCGLGSAVPASADLPPSAVTAINALKADYETAGAANGLAWSALAAIDYRESNNDPNRSALSGEPIGSTNPDSGVVTTSKADSLDRAAKHVKAMAASVYGVALTAASSGEDLALGFLAYNRGSIYARTSPPTPPTESPYAFNQHDSSHMDMTWPSIAGEPLAGQREYGRFGAVTVFERLGGSAAACGLSDDAMVRIAEMELGNYEDPDGANRGSTIDKYLGSSRTSLSDTDRAWCAMFVSWVHREAGRPFTGGVDGGWNLWGVAGVVAWTQAHGTWGSDPAKPPLPGDSMSVNGGEHVGIVEKVDGPVVTMISGNSSNRVQRTTHRIDESGVDGWGR